MRASMKIALALVIATGSAPAGQIRSTVPPASATSTSGARRPELPRAHVDTGTANMAGRVLSVPAGGDLQAALNAASPGDTIALEAGAVYRGPFTLPRKPGSTRIVVTTDARWSGLPPSGTRIDPSDADLLPKLVAASDPVLTIPPGAGGYRLVGLEIRPEPGHFLTNLVLIGASTGIVFDRCYLHGDPVKGTRRGLALNGGATAIVDSYLSDFTEVGGDSQAIAGWDGPGPFAIVNNHLEAAGEDVLFGGADPSVPNLVPSDIEIRHNHFVKSLTWKTDDRSYAGTPWTVKNLLELKNARRVLIDGNVFEYNWPQAQNGFGVLFTVRNQDGAAPWSTVEDVTFTNNVIRHVAGGINVLGSDDIHPSQQTRRILIRNNQFDDVGGVWGQGRLFQLLNGTASVVIDHNTAFQNDSFLLGGDTLPHTDFVFQNNVVQHNLYGVIGSDTGIGLPSLARYFPGSVFKRNVIVGGRAAQYPPNNFFPASTDQVGFLDWRGGDYRLADSSPFRNAGTDGHDVGVDPQALQAAASGADARPSGTQRVAQPRRHRRFADSGDPALGLGDRTVFWVSILLLAYTYVGYPALIWAWAALRPREPRGQRMAPAVSVLVVAHDEAATIAAKIENLLELHYPRERLEIVIASDGSTDATPDIARAYQPAGVSVAAFERRRGKAAVLNDVLPRLRGEIVLLADARQAIDHAALSTLVKPFADPTVGAVSGELMLSGGRSDPAGSAGVGCYWRYEKLIRQSESRVDSTLGATGALYAIRRTLFEPIPDDTILDDVLIPLRIARRGYRILFESGARAFDQVAAVRDELARKVRTSAGNFQLLARERWLLLPTRNRLWFQVVSHKGLRLLLPVLHTTTLAASVGLAGQAPVYLWALNLQILFYLAALGGYLLRHRRSPIPILAAPYVICLLSWATVLGLLRFLGGLQPVTWERTRVALESTGQKINQRRVS